MINIQTSINMKKKYLILVLIALFAACKNAIDVENLSRFHKVYIVQAGQNPYSSVLQITDSVQTMLITCGLGGNSPAQNDITVQLGVITDSVATYNENNSTDFVAMSDSSFELSSENVTIKKGEYLSSAIEIRFKTKGFIQPSKSYLLPISITAVGNGIPVNDNLRTLYLLITGAYAPGDEPPIKVFTLSDKSPIAAFPYQNAFIEVQSNGLFHTHEWDDQNKVYNPADVFPNGGWNIFNKVIGGNNELITRWAGTGDLWEYAFDVSSRSISSDYSAHGKGFNEYDMMSYSNQFDALLCRKPTGELYLIKRGPTMWDIVTHLGDGFSKYIMLTAYQDGFLCVDAQGEMFFYPIKSDLSLGDMIHVGSGWNKYQSIISNGAQLQALDNNGVVWQYNFTLAGFWKVH